MVEFFIHRPNFKCSFYDQYINVCMLSIQYHSKLSVHFTMSILIVIIVLIAIANYPVNAGLLIISFTYACIWNMLMLDFVLKDNDLQATMDIHIIIPIFTNMACYNTTIQFILYLDYRSSWRISSSTWIRSPSSILSV